MKWKYNKSLYSETGKAYICCLTNNEYIPGVLALAYSLLKVKSRYPLYIVTPNSISNEVEKALCVYDLHTISIEDIDVERSFINQSVVNKDVEHWKNTFFKLQVSKLKQFDKIVLLDADMMITRNIDHVFEYPHMSAVAAGNILHKEWVELNSGFMVVKPDESFDNHIKSKLFSAFEYFIKQEKSFGDQDIFNYCYRDWSDRKELHLPEIYNTMTNCINPVAKKYGYHRICVVHFIGKIKPWQNKSRSLFAVFKEAVKFCAFSEFKMYYKYRRILRTLKISLLS